MKHKSLIVSATLIILVIGIGLLSAFTINLNNKVSLKYSDAFPNLTFDYPDGIYNSADGTNRLFVTGQMGIIFVFNNQRKENTSTIFLDIRDRVHLGAFLGLAFDPLFSENRHFYVNYIADYPLRTIISQWSVLPNNPNEADKNSEKIMLEIPRLSESHGGGQLAFGPDGFLYIGLGDGSPYGDLSGNAQNCSSLLGKILRIDINNPSQQKNYSIPADNPFKGNTVGYKEEIYAYGFRNPWRFSFDSVTGKLWVGDVGQNRMEEIDVVEKGKNYGWNIMEGTLLYAGGNESGLQAPVWTYGRDQGNATIGGFVYRGTKLPQLAGSYIYGDYVSGRIWALNLNYGSDPVNKELLKTNLHITSFGLDEENELYFCADDGRIYELVKSS